MNDILILIKAILYRLFGTITTSVISYIISGSFYIGLSIGILDFISKIVLYYLYEKIWNYLIKRIK